MSNTITARPNFKKDGHKKERIIAGLDIGTSKVAVIMAIARPEGLDIVGLGQAPTAGVRNGMVVNIEATTEAIKKAKEEAELMSGYTLDQVWVGVSGSLVTSFDSKGMIAIKNKEVTSEDVMRVLEAAKTINVPTDREVLHVLPREFVIDNQAGILDPVGMSGVRLEAQVHIVTGSRTALQNLEKCAEKANLRVRGFVLQQLASALAVLTEDEKKLGVAIVDMGAGTSDVLCFVQGSVAFTTALQVGGQQFTQDISVGLRTPNTCAEEIKKKFGCAIGDLVNGDDLIDVAGVGGRQSRQVPKKYLSEVLEPRSEETLFLLRAKIDQSRLSPMLGSGIVLTGGACQLQGLAEMGEYIFEAPVRIGTPDKVTGLKEVVKSPTMSTAVGLIIYAQDLEKHNNTIKSLESGKGLFEDVSRKIKDLLGGAL